MFFHTILGSSHFSMQSGDRHLHYIKWGGGPNPSVLNESDLSAMKASGRFFARKFDGGSHPDLLDRVDRELLAAEQVRPRYSLYKQI
jgi:hypothetical protein